MKNDHLTAFTAEMPELSIRHLLDTALHEPGALHLIATGTADHRLRYGCHSHDVWELFCPLYGDLNFECLGCASRTFARGSVLLVPPGCLHMAIDKLPQESTLQVLVMNLPGAENPHGMVSVGGMHDRCRVAFSEKELVQWEELLGSHATNLFGAVARDLAAGEWGRERALARLRLVFAAYAEIIGNQQWRKRSARERHLTAAMAFLHSRYYDAELSVETIATAVGVSPSHLARLFRQATGKPLHGTLLDIRLRRAADLLVQGRHSIKHIAALTGWNSQLYFSTAFRKRHGQSPTAWRAQNNR